MVGGHEWNRTIKVRSTDKQIEKVRKINFCKCFTGSKERPKCVQRPKKLRVFIRKVKENGKRKEFRNECMRNDGNSSGIHTTEMN